MPYAMPQNITDDADCLFYHTMDLPDGTQNGLWDLRGRFTNYIGNVDLTGKRVLDVGCASGFLSFSAEAEGASEVVSFDMDHAGRQHLLPFHEKEYYRDHPAWMTTQTRLIQRWHNAYWKAHQAVKSHAKVYYGDVYDIPEVLGQFDVVIVGALFEHLADPIRAMASIARRCSGTMVISTDISGALDTEEPFAKFLGNADNPQADYVFWLYSLGVYRQLLKMLGFRIARTIPGMYRYNVLEGDFIRTAIVAERISN